MSLCDESNRYISLYFFQNGSCCIPEKVRVRQNGIDKIISKEGRFCYYRGKCIYSLKGDCICSLSKFKGNCAYVLVRPMDSFKPLNYSQVFNELIRKQITRHSLMDQHATCSKGNTNFRKCQSTPAIPISCRKCSEPCVKFVPCEDEESSDNECPCDAYLDNQCQSSVKKKKQEPKLPQELENVKKKGGFLATFCGCCVKPQVSLAPSKPMIECGYGKMTQTTKDDFKCAVARMKRAEAEERKRRKLYNKRAARKSSTMSTSRPTFCPPDEDDACHEDPKVLEKLENDRKKFMIRRLEMEKKISKLLDQKYEQLKKFGEC